VIETIKKNIENDGRRRVLSLESLIFIARSFEISIKDTGKIRKIPENMEKYKFVSQKWIILTIGEENCWESGEKS
jgi:hypothetical protein